MDSIEFSGPDVIIDIDESINLANVVGAEQKMCYRNAMMALVIATSRYGEQVYYCEGYASMGSLNGIPIHHAWLEARNGSVRVIADPTWVLCDDPHSERFCYHKLLELSLDDIDKLLKRRSKLMTPLSDNYRKELPKLTFLDANGFMDMVKLFNVSLANGVRNDQTCDSGDTDLQES